MSKFMFKAEGSFLLSLISAILLFLSEFFLLAYCWNIHNILVLAISRKCYLQDYTLFGLSLIARNVMIANHLTLT